MHDCRLRSLEVFEDEEGYLFVKDQCNMPFGKEHFSRVEFCPICGMKGKKSHIAGWPLFARNPAHSDKIPPAPDEFVREYTSEIGRIVREVNEAIAQIKLVLTVQGESNIIILNDIEELRERILKLEKNETNSSRPKFPIF